MTNRTYKGAEDLLPTAAQLLELRRAGVAAITVNTDGSLTLPLRAASSGQQRSACSGDDASSGWARKCVTDVMSVPRSF